MQEFLENLSEAIAAAILATGLCAVIFMCLLTYEGVLWW